MMKNYLVAICVALLFIVMPVSADYALHFQTLTNSPADGATNYIGIIPYAPTTTANFWKQEIPTSGWLNTTEIYDYSGTAGTAEAYTYYVRINNVANYLVASLSVSANERVFSNTSMGLYVNAGDTVEIVRVHPTWATNPLTNTVGGYILIDTPDGVDRGYPISGMAQSNSPADGATNYMGWIASLPTTSTGYYITILPTNGTAKKGYVYDYSGTAGTAEAYPYYLNINNVTQGIINTTAISNNLRLYNNTSMSVPVLRGDMLQFERKHPTWVTNPLTNAMGGNIWINTTDVHNIGDGYPLYVQGLSYTPADGQIVYFGNRPIAPSTVAATNKIYIRQKGVITRANIVSSSGTAGTSEAWPMYVRVNNTVDYLIETKSISANQRIWANTSINIPVNAGDYIEMKSVQPTFATNPATTLLGGYIYLEYLDNTPSVGFTSDVTFGDNPLTVHFTDQSATNILTWDWSWFNVDNGTTVHFNTTQNPEQVFDNGHYQIGLNVTNASGYKEYTGIYPISVTDSGGYTGLVSQDVFLEGQYTLTLHFITSDTAEMIPVVQVLDQSSGSTVNTTNGTYIGTYPFGAKAFIYYSDGYVSKTGSYFIDGNKEYTVQLTPTTVQQPSSSGKLNVLYPHEVRIITVDTNSNRLMGVQVTAVMQNSTIINTNWLTTLFGISEEATPIENTTLEGYTDSYGSVVFPMISSGKYRLSFSNASLGISQSLDLYPDQASYTYVLSTTALPAILESGDYINTTLTALDAAPNVYLNMTYSDTSATTNDVTFFIAYPNKTTMYSQTYQAIGGSNQSVNTSYPVTNIAGAAYVWGCKANTTTFGWQNTSKGITLKGSTGILYNPFVYKEGWY